MNETFSLKRFGTYFKFDITRLWRKHSKAVMLMAFSGVILYVVAVLFGLLFGHEYQGPGLIARFSVFVLAFFVLELYQTRFYGYITDKKEGTDWIMLPASKTEKFVSMLINTLIIIPVSFLCTYIFCDWLICLLDKTAGEALITGVSTVYGDIMNFSSFEELKEIGITPGFFFLMTILGGFANYLYFLLCGICFRKNKIFYAILILFGFSTVMSMLSAFIIPAIDFEGILGDMTEEKVKALFKGFMNVSLILSLILAVGLGWGVWQRINTIKH